jgi:hypothetical protein
MRRDWLIGLIVLMAILWPGQTVAGPDGVWLPVDARNKIVRIHVSGARFAYTAMVDYRCGMGVCSTLESLFEDDSQHPPIFSVPLEGIGPAPVLALRWQSGPPCNLAKLNDNPLALWANATLAPSGGMKFTAAGRAWCLVRPPAPRSGSPRAPR